MGTTATTSLDHGRRGRLDGQAAPVSAPNAVPGDAVGFALLLLLPR